jgi:flagellar protein FlaJ
LSSVSIIETGGDLSKFLENASKEALFDYKLKRESYLQTLSMYADIYTAVLIAAPLFFVSVLSIMALVGGQVLGLDVPTALRLGIYGIIPIMNIAFLAFIHYTQPAV